MTNKNSMIELVIAAILGSALAGNCDSGLKLRNLEKKLDNLKPKIIEKQVVGNPIPEKFYEIDGQKFYLTIDGKPVEEYFVGKKDAEMPYEGKK